MIRRWRAAVDAGLGSHAAFVLFLGTGLAYIALRSRNYQFDGLRYLIQARDAAGPADLLHPHHLLFTPLLWVTGELTTALVPAADPLLVVQVVMAACGAAGVAVFFILLREFLPASRAHATYAALLLAASYGYWHYATEPEPYVVALVLAMTAVLVVLRARRTLRVSAAVLAAALHGLAIGMHQMHVLLGVVLVGLALWPVTGDARRNRRFAAVYLGSVLALTAAMYLAAAWASGIPWSLSDILRWTTSYAHTGRWGGLTSMTLPYAAGGALLSVTGKSVIQQWLGGAASMPGGAGSLGLVSIIVGGVAGLLLIGLRNASVLWSRRGLATGCVLLPGAVYLPLLLWWEPYNPEFWIVLLPALWTALALITASTPLTWLSREAGRMALPCLAALLASHNMVFEIAPESRIANNEYHRLAGALTAVVGVEDLTVVPVPQVSVYGDYFFATPLRRIALHEMPAGTTDYGSNCRAVHAAIDRTLAGGHRVLLAEHEIAPPAANVKQLSKFSRAEYANCYEPYRRRLRRAFEYTWLGKSYTMFEIRPAQDRP